MELENLSLNRSLYRQTNIADGTNSVPGATAMAADNNSYATRLKSNDQTIKNAKEIVTGTVITGCIIQTSGLPHRVLMSDNDITFFDDTRVVNGEFVGDTSRLIFQSAKTDSGAFIMEKRVSLTDENDSVFSWFTTPPVSGHLNWMFIGRNASADDREYNLSAMYLAVNIQTALPASAGNGIWGLEVTENGAHTANDTFAILAGDTRRLFPSLGSTGYSTLISADNGGVVAMGYPVNPTVFNIMWYIKDSTNINMGANILPDADDAYDIGSAAKRVKDVHVGGRLNVGRVTDAGPMTNTNGTQGDIVFNTSNSKFYGCIVTGTPATWSALN